MIICGVSLNLFKSELHDLNNPFGRAHLPDTREPGVLII